MSRIDETRRAYERLTQLLDQEIRKRKGSAEELERFRQILDVAFYLLGWGQFEYLVRREAEQRIEDNARARTVARHAWAYLKQNLRSIPVRLRLDLIFDGDLEMRASLDKEYEVRNEAAHNYKMLPKDAREISAWLTKLEGLIARFCSMRSRSCGCLRPSHDERPVLHTSRLLLRPHQVTDLDRYALLMGSDESQYDPGAMPPLTLEEAWARLLRFVGHWAHFNYGLFIVEDRLSGELIGEVGYAHFQRGVHADFDTALEGAWRIALSRRRQGIAVEALQTALEWIEQTVRAARTVCMIHPTNEPSLKVAARLGYREFTRTRYKERTVALFERLAPG